MIIRKPHNAQSGFTLLELLLSISVIAALLVGAATVFNDWGKKSIDRKVSRQMEQLQRAAAEYVRLNIDNIIATDIPAIDDTAEININTDLIANGFLPSGYNRINAYRQNMRVFVRYLATGTINGDVIEVLSFSEGPTIDDKRLFNAASNGQESVGVISNLNISGTCCNGNAQSVTGAWSTALANYSAITAPDTTGGYMAAYNIISVDTLSNDYLFRSNVAGAPELNKMETNLNINNNDIIGAGVIISDSMEIAGNATFNGLQADGSLSPYVLAVRDDFNTDQDFTVNSGGIDEKGNVTIEGDDLFNIPGDEDFIVTGTLNMANITDPGSVIAEQITTSNFSGTSFNEFSNLDAGGGNVGANNIINSQLRFNDRIDTGTLQIVSTTNNIGAISATSGNFGITNVTDTSGLTVSPADINVIQSVNVIGITTTNSIESNTLTTINTLSCTTGCF